MPLGPIEVALVEDGEETQAISLRVDEMATFDLATIGEAVLTSSHALNVHGLVGNSGATYVLPNSPEPADKRGQAWSIPAMAGQHTVQLLSESANQIHITVDGETTIHYAMPTGLARTGVHFTHEVDLDEDTVVHITRAPPRLMLKASTGATEGLTAWPSSNGAYG